MREIPLTRGQVALVDDSDYEFLSQWKWCASKSKTGFFAVRRCILKNKKPYLLSMHRQILGLEYGDPRQGDHRNHNTLDNGRDNLRICSQYDNKKNKSPHKNSSSKYLGVGWHKGAKKWEAQITTNRKKIYLGLYRIEELAALAYDFAALKYHREFANFNFN